jgi:hypothetical protein
MGIMDLQDIWEVTIFISLITPIPFYLHLSQAKYNIAPTFLLTKALGDQQLMFLGSL